MSGNAKPGRRLRWLTVAAATALCAGAFARRRSKAAAMQSGLRLPAQGRPPRRSFLSRLAMHGCSSRPKRRWTPLQRQPRPKPGRSQRHRSRKMRRSPPAPLRSRPSAQKRQRNPRSHLRRGPRACSTCLPPRQLGRFHGNARQSRAGRTRGRRGNPHRDQRGRDRRRRGSRRGSLADFPSRLNHAIGYPGAIWAVRLSSTFVEPFAAWIDKPARIEERYRE